ncbi:uncharacterized protein MELLADRAFT_117668 [Melampsora larici-populina 98AG31]|uniref:histone acetyltransferase n=1 Tax=Melampsora larici-populina (strain 98AG31 / pathotype 3-4-7) TaxID=747676 RepID=F4S075_MELLP|nr:uncharacterized protein MELLADRAFT_117668 [Melampsora larici-populina 98AG31]EGG01985.1 hypothetical protein MELLADRAFT_117668 [Melampsora larici-populina 98AG31]
MENMENKANTNHKMDNIEKKEDTKHKMDQIENKEDMKDTNQQNEDNEIKKNDKTNSNSTIITNHQKHPTLHQSLLNSLSTLKTKTDSPRTFFLTTLKSKPFHTHTLFPHATNPNQSISRTDYLIVLAERFQNYHTNLIDKNLITVPIFALEASLYLIPTTSVGILYISKLDSTGLSPFPTPAKLLTERGKRILDDQQLIKWWKTVLSKPSSSIGPTHRFYILPGFDREESLAILPKLDQNWIYGHPYHVIGSPLKVSTQTDFLLSDLIPALCDDPKARFLQSLSRSSSNPAGEIGDWDDSLNERSSSGLESDRIRERKFLNMTSVDEFWERMGGRQECCDGRVSAFFVISGSTSIGNGTGGSNGNHDEDNGSIDSSAASKNQGDSKSSGSNGHVSSSVTRNLWVMLWSKFHNCDYSRLESAGTGYSAWIEAIQACIPASGFHKIHSELTIDQPDLETKKRTAECDSISPKKPAITILQPRKKVKSTV